MIFPIFFIAAYFSGGCLQRAVQEEKPETTDKTEPVRAPYVTIVSLADFHGALEPEIVHTLSGEAVEIGGAPLISAYIEIIRKKSEGPVILVDAGDMWQGSLVSNIAEGAPVVRFYNEIGMNAVAVGNHEFDYGPEGTDRVTPIGDDDPRGALKARISEAEFPFLGVNIRKNYGEIPSWAEASIIVEEMGLKIGITGGATVDTPSTTLVSNVAGLDFLPLHEAVMPEASSLREQGADFIITVVHAGGGCRDNTDPDDLSSCRDGELFQLVRSVPEGLVDVYAGGHSHAGIAKRVNGAGVIQPFAHGRFLGMARVRTDQTEPVELWEPIHVCGAVVDGPDGNPTCARRHVSQSEGPVRPAEFMGKKVKADQRIISLLEEDFERARKLTEKSLNVESSGVFNRAYDRESALGNLVADILLGSIDDAHAAFVNGGGLRAKLPSGELKYGDIFTALPFDNRISLLEIKGSTLRSIAEHGHAGGRSFFSWANLRFVANDCDLKEIIIGNEPLDDEATYRIVTNSFLADGGSGLDLIGIDPDSVSTFWELPVVRDVVANALENWDGPIDPVLFHDPESPRHKITGKCKAGASR